MNLENFMKKNHHIWSYCEGERLPLLEAAALPSVFTLGKEPFALGKGFAECSTRQNFS